MSSPSSGTEAVRLSGLSSGFDTKSIVEQLLAVDQSSIDKSKEKVEINKAKIETWLDISEQLKSLSESVKKLRADGTTGNTLFDDKLVDSNTATTATATATSSAITGEYNLTVTTLARAHVAYGSQKAAAYTLPAGGNVIINGATIALTAGDSLMGIANKIGIVNKG